MISLIESICVEQKKWITHDELMRVTVIAESTPGPIAINCATFVGYRQKGAAGAIASTLGVVTPSFIIIYLITVFMEHFLEIQGIVNGFKGIRIAVGIMIFDASLNMIKKMHKSILAYVILGCSFLVMMLNSIFSWHISSIVIMITAAVISLVVSCVSGLSSGKEGGKK